MTTPVTNGNAGPPGGNGASSGAGQPGNGASNGKEATLLRKVPAKMPPVKKPGGCTGKGFLPGQTGNPKGNKLGPRKEAFLFGNYLRAWLQEKAWVRDADGNKIKKDYRLKTMIEKMSDSRPDILLAYAYGKPVEVHEVAAAEGTELEFVVRVHGKDVP